MMRWASTRSLHELSNRFCQSHRIAVALNWLIPAIKRFGECPPLFGDKGDGGGAPATDSAGALGGPDELAGAGGGIVLEPPTVVFVGGIGLIEGTGNGGGEVTRGNADDGIGSDGDLHDDQAVGGGGGD